MSARSLRVGDVDVLVDEEGVRGEPVVVLQTALSIDELAPLVAALAVDHHVWHLRRPGYGANAGSPHAEPSMESDAEFLGSALGVLGLDSAHLVGASYSAAVVLRLAATRPTLVRSLTTIEPPPAGTTGAGEFRAANAQLLATYHREGTLPALDSFMRVIDGADWRANAERDLPGSVAQMERDAGTFFARDVPALLGWELSDPAIRAIDCPTLLVGGGESGPWFTQMLDRLADLLPDARRATVPGAGHGAALTHSAEVAVAVRAHVSASGSGSRSL